MSNQLLEKGSPLDLELEALRMTLNDPPQPQPKEKTSVWPVVGFFFALACGALAWVAFCGWLWDAAMGWIR